MSAFANAGELPPQQIWDGILGRTVHGERVTLSLLELDPDTVVPEHAHENEQIGILLEGSMTFTVGDETKEIVPGGTWRILADVPHSVVVGSEGAILVEVWSPIRADWSSKAFQEPRPPRWPQP
jgi:quercetin dioxygenase-like cupin family protein